MKRVVMVMVIAVLVGCGSSAEESELERRDRRWQSAYECMPPDTRRRFDELVLRFHDALARVRNQDPEAVADSPPDPDAESLKDREVRRINERVRGLVDEYVPRGGEDCAR